MKRWLIMTALILTPADAFAACECVCSSGSAKAMCTSPSDTPPATCTQDACAAPSGTNQTLRDQAGCQMVLVSSAPGGPYEWQQACP